MSTTVTILPPGFGSGSGGGDGGPPFGQSGAPDYPFDAPILGASGSAGAPEFAFSGAQGTGMFASSGHLGLSVGGTERLGLSSSGAAQFSGSASFGGPLGLSSGAAIYNGPLSNPDGQQTAAVGSLYLSSNGGPDSTVFYKETGIDAFGWRAIKSSDGGSGGSVSFPLYGPSSGPIAPSYAFEDGSGQPSQLGLYGVNGNEIGFACGGQRVFYADVNSVIYAKSAQLQNATLSGALSAAQGQFTAGLTVTGKLAYASGPTIQVGSGEPEGQISAVPGSLFLRNDGDVPALYSKVSGPDATGWSQLAASDPDSGSGSGGKIPFPLTAPSGDPSSPSYAFSDDEGAGLSFQRQTLSLSVAGQSVLSASDMDGLRINSSLTANDGSFMGSLIVNQQFSVASDATLSGPVHLSTGASLLAGTAATPEGNVQAAPGSLYLSSAGGPSSTLFVKEQGDDASGWTALAGSSSSGGGAGGGSGALTYPLQAPAGDPDAPSYGFASGPQGMDGYDDGSLSLFTNGHVQLRIDQDGSAQFYKSLEVRSDTHVDGDFSLQGDAVLNGNLSIGGSTSANALSVAGDLEGTSASFTSLLQAKAGLTLGPKATILSGTLASPEGSVSAVASSLYLSSSGGSGHTLFVKETDSSGNASATGWVAASGAGSQTPVPPSYPLQAPATSASAPSYAFAGSNGVNGGLYGLSDGSVGLSSNGVSAVELSPSGGLRLQGSLSLPSGSLSVAASSNFSGNVTLAGNTNVTGTLTLSGPLTVPSLTVSGASRLKGVINADSSLAIGTDLNVAGNSTLTTLSAQATTVTQLSASGSASFAQGLTVGGAQVLSGSGSPNGQVSAAQGSVYLSTTGGTNATLWVRQTGSATSWTYLGAPNQISYPLRAPSAGSAASTVIGFTADNGASGIYAPSSGALGFATAGTAALTLGTDQSASFAGPVTASAGLTIGSGGQLLAQGSAKLSGACEFVSAALFDQGVSFPGGELLLGGSQANPNGSVTAAAGSLYLSSAGGLNKTLWVKESGASSTSGWVSYGNPATAAPPYPLQAPNGSATAPSFSFTASTSTGLFSPSTGALALATSGTAALTLSATQAATFASTLSATSVLGTGAGTASAASLQAGGAGTGLFADSANKGLGVTAGGTQLAYFGGTGALSALGVIGSLAVGGTVATGTAAPANGLLVQGATNLQGALGVTGASTFTGNATFNGSATFNGPVSGITATASFPLAGPTGTAASPQVSYAFSGKTTSGMGYDSTNSVVALYNANSPMLQVGASGVGVGGCIPTAQGVLALFGSSGNAGVSVGSNSPTVQLTANASGGGYFTVSSSSTAAGLLAGFNNYTGGGVPVGAQVGSVSAGAPLMLLSGSSYSSVAATAYNTSGSYFWSFGGTTKGQSLVNVLGNLAIGSTVSTNTAAPANGLLVQGVSQFQGAAAFGGWTGDTSNSDGGVQLNASANLAANVAFYSQASLAGSIGINNYNGGANNPVGLWLRSYAANQSIFITASTSTGTANYGIKVNPNGGVTVGGTGGAPDNGLSVQGATTFGGDVSSTGNLTCVRPVANNTSSTNVGAADNNKHFVNYGAGAMAYTLVGNSGSPIQGARYTFTNYTSNKMSVTAGSNASLISPMTGTPSSAGQTISTSQPGASITIEGVLTVGGVNFNNWVVVAQTGNWAAG